MTPINTPHYGENSTSHPPYISFQNSLSPTYWLNHQKAFLNLLVCPRFTLQDYLVLQIVVERLDHWSSRLITRQDHPLNQEPYQKRRELVLLQSLGIRMKEPLVVLCCCCLPAHLSQWPLIPWRNILRWKLSGLRVCLFSTLQLCFLLATAQPCLDRPLLGLNYCCYCLTNLSLVSTVVLFTPLFVAGCPFSSTWPPFGLFLWCGLLFLTCLCSPSQLPR